MSDFPHCCILYLLSVKALRPFPISFFRCFSFPFVSHIVFVFRQIFILCFGSCLFLTFIFNIDRLRYEKSPAHGGRNNLWHINSVKQNEKNDRDGAKNQSDKQKTGIPVKFSLRMFAFSIFGIRLVGLFDEGNQHADKSSERKSDTVEGTASAGKQQARQQHKNHSGNGKSVTETPVFFRLLRHGKVAFNSQDAQRHQSSDDADDQVFDYRISYVFIQGLSLKVAAVFYTSLLPRHYNIRNARARPRA